MRFYNSVGPNPRVVRMFMAERGIEIPREEIDLRGGENRRAPYLSKNPLGQMPALELDDGRVLTEITAICEYLDEVTPGPLLVGSTPEQRAEARMWVRRTDLNIVEPMAQGYRYSDGLRLFRDRIHTIPQAADDLKQIARKHLAWLDGQMRGKRFLCGDRFSFADVFLFPFLEFFPMVKQPLDPALTNIASWIGRMKERPSAAA